MWVVNKRVARNLRAGKVKWGGVFIIIVLCIYYMVAGLGSAYESQYNHALNFEENKARNGRFTALAELYDEEILNGEKLGFDIERECYLDYPALENAKVRVFRNRTKVDLVFCDEGRLPENESEIVLEKHFCEKNDIHAGDIINIAGLDFTVSGIGGAPDSEYVTDISGESVNHKFFANGYVTDEGYECLKKTSKMIGSETYRYAYRKLDETTKDGILEDYLRDMDFDEGRIENVYFKEMLSELLKSKVDIESSMKDMNVACDNLNSSAKEFDKSARDMCEAAEDFCDVVKNDLVKGIVDLTEGVEELDNNSDKLNEGADRIFDIFLTNAENGCNDYGVHIDLTKDNYETALRSADFSSSSNKTSETVNSLISSLQQIESFCSAMHSYTDGINEASRGSSQLRAASEQLSAASEQFKQGLDQYAAAPEFAGTFESLSYGYGAISEGLNNTGNGIAQLASALDKINSSSGLIIAGSDQIFDLILSDVSSRVSGYGVPVTLTRENYVSVLDSVKNSINSKISDTAVKSVDELIVSLNGYKEFSDGIKEYTQSVGKLQDGIKSLDEVTPELTENAESLLEAANEFADHTAELKDGVGEFSEAIDGFNDNVSELDEMFEVDYDIIESFETMRYNTGVYNTAQNDIDTVRMCEILIFIIVGFIFTVFISQDIDNESSVIGALYSMGVKKSNLVLHYMTIPLLIASVGGTVGMLLGVSPLGIDMMNKSIESYYSLPKFVSHFDIRLLLLGVIIPTLISSAVAFVIINAKLSRSPLSLLRHERKIKRVRIGRIERMTFLNSFRIKHFFTEIGSSLIVFFGMLLSLMLLIYALNFAVAVKPALEGAEKDIMFEELCVMKYAPKAVPEGAEKVYMESGIIGRTSITLMGIETDSKCFGFSVKNNGRNKISIGSGTARKYGLKAGDLFTINCKSRSRYYTFEIEDVVDFSPGLYVFMKIDDMRRVFGENDDYYNALISEKKINIERGRVFSDFTKETIVISVKDSCNNNLLLIILFLSITIAVYVIITFLMIKQKIDQARLNISLFRVFGYNKFEIKQLFIDGNFYLILFSVIVGLPVAKMFVDKVWFPAATYGSDMGYETSFPLWLYLIIIIATVLIYIIVSTVISAIANRITVSEILKNRE